ncbi:DUF6090 family protein [Robiginitalea sp. IMCC44478]|uniref:DUF6090 family protein n=1 Tax=Robiginitalea sp. IMCC44478 TaxID=3459122 RepID=UPI0040415FFD
MKFFRNIRQQMLGDQKIRKYFFYAFGEILLVVIGILIALQINNWSEYRKDRETEASYLERLLIELETNKRIAIRQEDFAGFQIENAKIILDFLKEEYLPENNETILYALEHIRWAEPLNIFESTIWKELQSTGSLSLIEDQNLKTEVGKLYRDITIYQGYTEEWNSYNLLFRNLLTDIIPADTRLGIHQNLIVHAESGNLIQLKSAIDPTLLKARLNSIPALSDHLADVMIVRNSSKGRCVTMQKAVANLTSSIKAQLNRSE